MDVGNWNYVVRQLGFHDLLLDQLVEGMEIGGPVALELVLSLCRVVLEGYDSGMELLVKHL